MDIGVSVLSVLEFFLTTIFAFWPILVLAPLTWKRVSVNQNIAVWGILAIVRVSLFLLPGEGISLIPEPLSSILFFLAGIILFGIALVQRRFRKGERSIRQKSINSVKDFLRLEPDEFEMIVARIFQKMGHEVSLTGGQGDHGVDLRVLTKKGEKWIVQCKNWEGSVGEPAIRDLYGVLDHQNADRAALITSGTFTNQALQWAEGKPIDLITGERLLEIWRTVTK